MGPGAGNSSDGMELRQLIAKRSSIKGQITKFKGFLDKITQKTILSGVEFTELNLKLTKFEGLLGRFDDLQTQIEILNIESIETEIDERDTIEQEIIITIATAKMYIDKINLQNETRRPSQDFNAQCRHDHRDLGVKLPQIQIAKFGGSFFRWLEFRDTYLSLIHENENISSIQKFHYLISYLEGDAARIISNLEVSSDNYKEAWSLLSERYDNKRLLVNHHLKSLFDIHPVARESDRSLRFLVDHVTKNLRALSSLGQPTEHWDTLIIHIMTSKLDIRTLTKWEELRNTFDEYPTLDRFHKFLTDRADVLESLSRNKSDISPKSSQPSPSSSFSNNQNSNNYNKFQQFPSSSFNNTQNNNYNKFQQKGQNTSTKSFAASNTNLNHRCIICDQNHKIYDCSTFKSMDYQTKLNSVNNYKLCMNCLRQGHALIDCRMGPCRECKQNHNTILHNNFTSTNSKDVVSDTISNFSNHVDSQSQVILSTAIVEMINPNTKKSIKARILLDCGSESSFISKSLQQKLNLPSTLIDMNVIGIGNNITNKIKETCVAKLKSINKPFELTVSCFVMDQLTGELPKVPINVQQLKLPKNITLADPSYHSPAPIDLLIGADIFWEILGLEQKSLGPNNPKLIDSKLGWLITGPVCSAVSNQKQLYCNHMMISKTQNNDIETLITKFWELDEVPQKPVLNNSDRACEEHFNTHTRRLESGRFSVRLPLIDSPDCLGNSYNLAKKRLLNIEKRFIKNQALKNEYALFLREYAELGHASISAISIPNEAYFLCHHPVFKQNSESTKLRVVFDGSAPSSSGYSVNDLQMVGPNVQDSLFSILIRARQYKYLLTGDVEKMYRQIEVDVKDRNLQLILWREDESLPIQTWQLNTLTYGTASASYLSTRCLWQIGEECGDQLTKMIIQKDFYVDDLITGSDYPEQLDYIKRSVSQALNSGCFNLRKFKTNLPAILENNNSNDSQDSLMISESTNTLGLNWDPSQDTLNFPTIISPDSNKITKRFIMSHSLKIFDPLGLLSPCIIIPKIILQRLWLAKIDWDVPVPQEIENDWNEFTSKLPVLSKIHITRNVICNSPKEIEIHSFSDASEKALGACIYVRSTDSSNHVTVRLLCSKSRVARLRPTTIPRQELCAALLAARLTAAVLGSIRYVPTRILHWCDSSIVLSWLNGDTRKLKTFVANRVGEILETTERTSWRYTPTNANPADLISRGVNPSAISELKLWWTGPEFLTKSESDWPTLRIKYDKKLPETKSNFAINSTDPVIKIENYSNLYKLQNIVGYIKRFIYNLKNPKSRRTEKSLTVDELNDSFNYLCMLSQQQSFPQECKLLKNKKPLSPRSKILSLSPFVDDGNLIRVGGRINSSSYSYSKKHPILLDSSHHLARLFCEYKHKENLHAGPQLLLAIVRETVWPTNGRNLTRRVFRNCTVCKRFQASLLTPKMGDLPSQRITPDFPFKTVGIDFAGPFMIINRKGRGARLLKCYMCLFVCLRYKCVHLEAVSDLTKDAFLMTLRRFIARRGKPAEIYCDNGRNFVAAAKEINYFLNTRSNDLVEFANQQNIKFFFSPPYAPHFGGIFEAGIRSAKYHIKRVMGNAHLTFEEISTLFAQVEAILNSRPLSPLSSSPSDFLPLSPGHFLIGRPLTALPAPSSEERAEVPSRNRYRQLENIRQHFWKRWQREYICELQHRTKWKSNTDKLNVGDLVLLHEDNVPPLCWRLGRVTRLFQGADGISRVADVMTARGSARRALVRLCPLLPVNQRD